MEDLEGYRRRISSLIEKAYLGGVSLLPFLDEAMMGIVIEEMKYQSGIEYRFEGGILNSDRKRCIISPYLIKDSDFKIVLYEIKYNTKYYELYHRSILGSLMSLGIKRESIGDIVILDKKVYFAATEEISKFLESEFKNVGKAPIELIRTNERIQNEIRYQSKVCFLASLRLDCVIAQAYNMSRNEVLEILASGDVSIGHILNQNPSHICKHEDLISVRHKGRVKITEIGGRTKSGRIAVTLSKRC